MKIDIEQEEDGRWLGSVEGLPGVMAYGSTIVEAVRNTRAKALCAIAIKLEHNESLTDDVQRALIEFIPVRSV